MPIISDQQNALLLNQAFISRVSSQDEATKTASMMTDFIRVIIRENGFTRSILPPKPVTATDLVQSVDTDQPRRIVEMDRVSEAYPITFLEGTKEKYYKGRKFEVFYTKIASEEFYKPTQEILTYRVPIKTIVQENYLKDIHIAEDKLFINAINKIIDDRLAGKTESGVIDTDAEFTCAGPFVPSVVAELAKRLTLKQVPQGPILINDADFQDLLKVDHATVGSAVMQDIIIEGYKYTKILGHTFIRTIKHDIVPPGILYMFTTPEYLGVFDVLEDVKMFLKQEGSHLRFYLWETIGIAIGNINGVVRGKLTK